jgi:hypothetical protein
MTPADLDQIKYLPVLRSRQAELRGYGQLRPETKQSLLPLISLGKLGRIEQPERVLETVRENVGGPFFVDLNSNPGQLCGGFDMLCQPADAYGLWRTLARSCEMAVPVALLREGAPERPFIQQVRRIEADYQVVAIRARRPAQDLPSLQAALSAVDDVNNLLIILDFAYIRGSLDLKENEALRIISALRIVDPGVRVVVLASSFPKAVTAYGDARGSLEILERSFHWHVGGDEVSIYGDHCAIYPVPYEPSISRFVPRIDYCTELSWLYERRREDDGGYLACARSIVELPDWDPAFAAQVWGARVIEEAAASATVPAGFGSPSRWISARLNMHIERQVAFSRREADPEEYDED